MRGSQQAEGAVGAEVGVVEAGVRGLEEVERLASVEEFGG